MKLIIQPIPDNFLTSEALEKPSQQDLFNAQGCLLLEKGERVTHRIIEDVQRGNVYVLTYEWNKRYNQNASLSLEHQHSINLFNRIYYEENFIREDLLHTATTIVGMLLHDSKENSDFPINLRELESYDNYTYVHSVNVAVLATIMGLQLGYELERLSNLTLGALLHDWGKLLIPSEILNKPSGLTAKEFDIIRQHPLTGEQMLKPVVSSNEILRIVRHHHERLDGQGYPDGLSGEEIFQSAQIVGVADVFDALTADRPYRAGLSPYHALEMILSGVNRNFSSEVVKAFRSCLTLYPENSWVTLNTGETGIVIAIPLDLPTRPAIRVLLDSNGQRETNEKIVDLFQDLSLSVTSIDFSASAQEMRIIGF